MSPTQTPKSCLAGSVEAQTSAGKAVLGPRKVWACSEHGLGLTVKATLPQAPRGPFSFCHIPEFSWTWLDPMSGSGSMSGPPCLEVPSFVPPSSTCS